MPTFTDIQDWLSLIPVTLASWISKMGNIQAISSDMISKDLTSSGTGLEKPHTWTRYWKLTREKFCFIMVLITIRAPCQRNGYANGLWCRKNGGKRFCRGYYSVLFLYQNCAYVLSNQTACNRGSTNFLHSWTTFRPPWLAESCRITLLTYASRLSNLYVFGG